MGILFCWDPTNKMICAESGAAEDREWDMETTRR